ncbi:hypothetical protein MA16_Dca020008 [Dendrobium catenatum]|uniref:Uncharacterized protein n=1 Tax=Dendrobium catenatum TaxID=906689 RepID=A0A2I0X9H4_9ASPA|nr:hypothetical protein MA16_Dca020008 [Dendrobium catenatum]
MIEMVPTGSPRSRICCFNHSTCATQLPTAIYSASAVESATEFCFLLDQETNDCPMNWQVPEVLFLSILHPAKSESEYPRISKEVLCLGYQIPKFGVPSRYLRILLTAVR